MERPTGNGSLIFSIKSSLSFLSNDCELLAANCNTVIGVDPEIELLHNGECMEDKICETCLWSGPPKPVCGSDGITYK